MPLIVPQEFAVIRAERFSVDVLNAFLLWFLFDFGFKSHFKLFFFLEQFVDLTFKIVSLLLTLKLQIFKFIFSNFFNSSQLIFNLLPYHLNLSNLQVLLFALMLYLEYFLFMTLFQTHHLLVHFLHLWMKFLIFSHQETHFIILLLKDYFGLIEFLVNILKSHFVELLI